MQVKIIIKRTAKPEKHQELKPMLIELRRLAMAQPGYVTGETLVNFDNPDEVLVLTTWKSMDEWEKWLGSETRQGIQKQIDDILGEPTYYQLYYYG
jgi:quinol monooxygenase YgiN